MFYTDGVSEATNAKSEMYESERLASVVEKNRNSPAQDLLEAIRKDVRKFEPKSIQHDDITFIVVKIV